MKFSILTLAAAVPALAATVPASADTAEGIFPPMDLNTSLSVINYIPSQARQLQVDPPMDFQLE